MNKTSYIAVIAAAGIGKRVGADIPKQYLQIKNKTIIEHSISPFLNSDKIKQVIVSIAKNDIWFNKLAIAQHKKVKVVIGGKERVESVLAALNIIDKDEYVLIHDAARPCILQSDINKLIDTVVSSSEGAILASRVRDTMKRSLNSGQIVKTVPRDNLWHALTPQMFNNGQLIAAINTADNPTLITDEASAMELSGIAVNIVEGRSDNLKVTREEDLMLAELYLTKNKETE